MCREKVILAAHYPQPKRVAVLIEIDDSWGRNVLEAIASYACDRNWQLLLCPRDGQRRLRIPYSWSGDGILALLRDSTLAEHVRSLSLPTVDVSAMNLEQRWLGHVLTDDHVRATMAFEHFRQRRLENFACYCPPMGRYSDDRGKKFETVVVKAGYTCELYQEPTPTVNDDSSSTTDYAVDWLMTLSRPVGVFAADPFPARQLVQACATANLSVPADVAILSGDEDDLLCERVRPPITSIELASHRIGFEASKMLDGMMRTRKIPESPVLVTPLRVCPRRSTDSLSVADPELAAVVKTIWERASEEFEIDELAEAAAISRRKLELRFREVLGCSIADEIRRIRLEKARQLIVTTSLSVYSVAVATGFSSGPYLTHIFRKHFGVTPSELRIGRSK
jgi:LacI family transcriptional regulator